jgi:glycosyltransferase involved in cell wall biosynthesis
MRGIGRRRSRRALAAADLVLADSEHLARAVRELADVRVEVVRWSLDLDLFSPGDAGAAREALGLPADGALVVSVRGVDALYNPRLLLEAFRRVRRRRPDVRLLLKSPDGRAAPIADGVTLLGHVPWARMPDVYRAADVVVSLASSDSSPRSVWEALACARPVVVSDLPWARDELEDGRNALLAPLDAEAVAHAIERALDDDTLGPAGRAVAQAELDPAACTSRIDALYRAVVENRL